MTFSGRVTIFLEILNKGQVCSSDYSKTTWTVLLVKSAESTWGNPAALKAEQLRVGLTRLTFGVCGLHGKIWLMTHSSHFPLFYPNKSWGMNLRAHSTYHSELCWSCFFILTSPSPSSPSVCFGSESSPVSHQLYFMPSEIYGVHFKLAALSSIFHLVLEACVKDRNHPQAVGSKTCPASFWASTLQSGEEICFSDLLFSCILPTAWIVKRKQTQKQQESHSWTFTFPGLVRYSNRQ